MKYYIFLILVLNLSNSYSQINTFIKQYTSTTHHFNLNSITTTSDNGYILSGHVGGGMLIKIDSLGNTVWSYIYDAPFSNRFSCILNTLDDNYLVSGSRGFSFSPYLGAYYMKIDSAGNIIWSKLLQSGTLISNISASIQDNAGNFFLAGITDQTYPSIAVAKLDSSGNYLWYNRYNSSSNGYHNRAHSIRIYDDFVYVIGKVDTNNTNHAAFIMKMDMDGNLLWTKKYVSNNSSNQLWGNDLLLLNNEFYFLSQFAGGLILSKIDTVGNIQWVKSYQYPNGIACVYYADICNGQKFIYSPDTNSIHVKISSFNAPGGSVIKFDLNGNIISSYTYQNTVNDALYHDSSYVVVGIGPLNGLFSPTVLYESGVVKESLTGINTSCFVANNITPVTASITSQPYSFVSVDTGGSVTTFNSAISPYNLNANNLCVSISDINEISNESVVSVYPNPATNEINISFYLNSNSEVKIELYKPLGQIVKTINKGKLPAGRNEINFSVADFAKGIYHFKFSAGDEVVVRRVVKM